MNRAETRAWRLRRLSRRRWKAFARQAGWFAAALPVALLILEAALRLTYHQALDDIPGFFAADEELVFVNAPGTDIVWRNPEFTYEVRINKLGLREDREVPPKAPGEFRILCAGDSTTFGHGVEVEQTYPRQLEKLLNDLKEKPAGVEFFTVWNAGVMAYSTEQVAGLAERMALEIDPDLFLFGVSASFHMQQAPVLPRNATVRDGKVVPREEPKFSPVVTAELWLRRNSHLYSFVRAGAMPHFVKWGWVERGKARTLKPEAHDMWLNYIAAREGVERIAALGVPGAIVFFPDILHANVERFNKLKADIGDVAFGNLDQLLIPRSLRDWAANDGVPLIDPTLRILRDAEGAHSFYPVDMHLNARGLESVAREVWARLSADELLDPAATLDHAAEIVARAELREEEAAAAKAAKESSAGAAGASAAGSGASEAAE
jgi:hypothetical protein